MAKVINKDNFQDKPTLGAKDSTLLKVTPNQLEVGVIKSRGFQSIPHGMVIKIDANSEEDFILSGCPLKKVGMDGNIIVADLAKKNVDNTYPEVIAYCERQESDMFNAVYNKTTGIKYSAIQKDTPTEVYDTRTGSFEFDINVVFGEDMTFDDEVTISDNALTYIKWTSGKPKLGRVVKPALANKVGVIKIFK